MKEFGLDNTTTTMLRCAVMVKETISVTEAAKRLSIGLNHLYALLWSGKLDGRKVGGRWEVSLQAVEERLKLLRSNGRE